MNILKGPLKLILLNNYYIPDLMTNLVSGNILQDKGLDIDS